LRADWPCVAGQPLLALRALWPCRTWFALDALGTNWSLFPQGTLRTCGSDSTGDSLVSLWPRRSDRPDVTGQSLLALGTGRSDDSCFPLGTGRAGIALRARHPLWPRVSLRANGTGSALRALRPRLALRALWAGDGNGA
jgi:hypothetical protein